MASDLYPKAQAYIVTSEAPRIAGRDRCVKRWGVLADTGQIAVEIVKGRVSPGCVVEVTEETLSSDELSAIHLTGHRVLVL